MLALLIHTYIHTYGSASGGDHMNVNGGAYSTLLVKVYNKSVTFTPMHGTYLFCACNPVPVCTASMHLRLNAVNHLSLAC